MTACKFDFAGRDTGPSEPCVLEAGHANKGIAHQREDGATSTLGVVSRTAICYREDGSFKWATLLPDGTKLPHTTLEPGDKLWPNVAFGKELDGRTFFVPVGKPVVGT